MSLSRTLNLIFRWSLFSAILAAILWSVWALTGAAIPAADPVHYPIGKTFRFDAIASRAWDPLGLAILAALTVCGCALVEKLEEWQRDLGAFVGISALAGLLIGGGGYYAWSSMAQPAQWMPVVLLTLSAATGLVTGALGVGGLPTRTVLSAAFFGPLAFCTGAAAFGGIGEGFMHAVATAIPLGFIGAIAASTLCLVTTAILKAGFWSWLGRWLSARQMPTVAAAAKLDDGVEASEASGVSIAADLDAINAELARMDIRRSELEARKTELEQHPDATRF